MRIVGRKRESEKIIKRYAISTENVKNYKEIDYSKNDVADKTYEVNRFLEDSREFWAVKTVKQFTEI